MIGDLLKRVGKVCVGYLAATAMASLALTAMFFVFSVVAEFRRDVSAIEIFDASISLAGGILVFGTIYIFLMAMPVFAIVALIAERWAIRSRRYYLVGGSMAGLPMPLLEIRGSASDYMLLVAVMVSGLFGGWAYWKVAGNRSGANADAVPA